MITPLVPEKNDINYKKRMKGYKQRPEDVPHSFNEIDLNFTSIEKGAEYKPL